jgi:HKD family nuclease
MLQLQNQESNEIQSPMIKLVTSNTHEEVYSLLHNARNVYLISPFIGINTSKALAQVINEKKLKATVITRFSRNDFYNNVSSIEGLLILKEAGCNLKAVKKLHTKLYLFDSDSMILGSSNFTDGGLMTNLELNILFMDEKNIINQGIAYFNEIDINIESEFFITKEMILEEMKVLKSVPKRKKQVFPEDLDFGKIFTPKKNIDKIEELFTPKELKKNKISTSWIKFEGFSDKRRTKNDEPLIIELNENNFYRTRFPKKPKGYKNGDLIFIARNSWDKNGNITPVIYGYGITRKFDEHNVLSIEEQESDENFKRWPYYIYVENFRHITTKLLDGISLLDLYREIGSNTYPGSKKRNSSFADLKRIHIQKDKLRISEEAKEYLLENLSKIL